MKAKVGICKENRNGIWEYWDKAIGEEQYNKIIDVVGECEDYYDFKEDYKAWNGKNKKERREYIVFLVFKGGGSFKFKMMGTNNITVYLESMLKNKGKKVRRYNDLMRNNKKGTITKEYLIFDNEEVVCAHAIEYDEYLKRRDNNEIYF